MNSLILVALITRTVLLILFGVVFFLAAVVAWYEVVYQKRNGLTLAMRNLFLASALFFFTTAPLTIFVLVDTVDRSPVTFLALVILSIAAQVYQSITSIVVAMRALGEPAE